ncbi:MAG: nucleotide exchange factor GrpE [Lachnospiraceae bacterium]|nr:nucleotide exchange factor GrpE [Lachnospiraceae bacterium]
MSDIDEETLNKETGDTESVKESADGTAPEDFGEQTGESEKASEDAGKTSEESVDDIASEDAPGETDDAAADTDDGSGDTDQKEDRKKFGKKKKDKKDKKDELIEELNDRVKRQMAEFENFRKRTDKEKSSMYEMGARSVIEKILPVIDNFERGLDTVSEEDKQTGFCEGMNKIYKQLITELENLGVKPIEALGKEFDPNLHNAVMQIDSEEYDSGIVGQELQKGYMYRDSVVRHSMVAVVK